LAIGGEERSVDDRGGGGEAHGFAASAGDDPNVVGVPKGDLIVAE
jgi:hypothetical protein